jgi:hypothetical protein
MNIHHLFATMAAIAQDQHPQEMKETSLHKIKRDYSLLPEGLRKTFVLWAIAHPQEHLIDLIEEEFYEHANPPAAPLPTPLDPEWTTDHSISDFYREYG